MKESASCVEKFLKNKKILIICASIIIILLIVGGIFFFKKDKTSDKEEKVLKEQNYTMYVSINPLVKFVFKESYYECKGDNGNKTICSEVSNEVLDYTLINDDAKEFYKDLNFKGKTYIDTLIMLCDVARDNNVSFESIDLVTDYNKISYDKVLEEVKNNSRYDYEFNIFIDVKEKLVEEEIIENIEKESKVFTVKFDTNGGSNIDDRLVKENTILGNIVIPKKDGYKFVEWQVDGKKYDENTLVTSDIILKAKWEKVSKEEPIKEPNKEDTNVSEEAITKTINIKNPKIKAINLYSDGKIKVVEPYFYGNDSVINVKVEGKKSLVDKIDASNISLGVDMSKYKKETSIVEDSIIVTNKVDGVKYEVLNPKVNMNVSTTKIISSTIDKINLNDNILVVEWYAVNSLCGSSYIASNYKDVFKDYLTGNTLAIVSDDYEYDTDKEIKETIFNNLLPSLVVDNAKVKDITTKLENIKNGKYRNIANFEYKIDASSGEYSYNFNRLIVVDHSIDKLSDEFEKYPILDNIQNDTSVFTTFRMYGDMYDESEATILNETLCSKYNLTCSRW